MLFIIYYIDTSVLLESIPLVKFRKTTFATGVVYFPYFLVAKTIFYSLAAFVRKILFCHSKIKFISSPHRVISSINCTRKKRAVEHAQAQWDTTGSQI